MQTKKPPPPPEPIFPQLLTPNFTVESWNKLSLCQLPHPAMKQQWCQRHDDFMDMSSRTGSTVPVVGQPYDPESAYHGLFGREAESRIGKCDSMNAKLCGTKTSSPPKQMNNICDTVSQVRHYRFPV